MDHQAAVRGCLLAAALAAGCTPSPHFGEVLVEVDAEPGVPGFLSRLRVDLYREDGSWYESRDVGAPNVADWPLSFSLYTDEKAGQSVRLRLRGYPEGGVRDFRGERFASPAPWIDPPSAHSLSQLCGSAPILAPGQSLQLRRAAQPFTDFVAGGDCVPPNNAGSVAVRVEIQESASYRFEVIAANPDGSLNDLAGDTVLFLRSNCADATTQLGCADDIDKASGNYLSRLIVTLAPGEYWLISGGHTRSPADLTLRWAREDQWDVSAPSVDGGPPDLLTDPRDVLEGGDTPATEPEPSLAIDLVTDVHVNYGTRKTARFLLRGECLGTQADLRNGQSCVDTAAARAKVAPATLVDGIHHTTKSLAGSWQAETPIDCGVTPRPPTTGTEPLYDEEVCVRGGAFTLGNADEIGFGARDPAPQQVAVVPPFLLDRWEFTVARYRQALADGFQPPDSGPGVNDLSIASTPSDDHDPQLCTYSSQPMGRESFPLNCVSWYTARALCQFLGSDLPTHVQWEYAAVGAGHPDGDAIYPWGDDRPDCCGAVWGRGLFSDSCNSPGTACFGVGPVAVDASPYSDGDVSASGVNGLGGNLTEMVLDAFEGYSSPCWWQSPLRGIFCSEQEAPYRSLRGGAWLEDIAFGRSAVLAGIETGLTNSGAGFRCARPGVQ
jgi:formylglycine-generating enzyme required for sulfatase activity